MTSLSCKTHRVDKTEKKTKLQKQKQTNKQTNKQQQQYLHESRFSCKSTNLRVKEK